MRSLHFPQTQEDQGPQSEQPATHPFVILHQEDELARLLELVDDNCPWSTRQVETRIGSHIAGRTRRALFQRWSYPSFDHVGYEVAIQILLMSRKKGIHSPTHLQFDTIRKLRTVYANHLRAAPQSNKVTLSLGDQKGSYTRFTYNKCASLWFYRILEGYSHRMGQIWRPNQALSNELLLEVLSQIEERIERVQTGRDENRWTTLHTLIVTTYVSFLRRPKGFTMLT
jgi:hypothetical protein